MQANGQRLPALDGQTMSAVRLGAGTCSRSTSSTSGSVVKKDVKGTGDPEGIMDAVGRQPIGLAAVAIREGLFVPPRHAIWPALGGQSVTLARGNLLPPFLKCEFDLLPKWRPRTCHLSHVCCGCIWSSSLIVCRQVPPDNPKVGL